MDVTIHPGMLSGVVHAVASKSVAHRVLFCAAIADEPTIIHCNTTSQDIEATLRCLEALGATITLGQDNTLQVTPIDHASIVDDPEKPVELDCGESGSTLRFLLSLVGALGITARLHRAGRLGKRPLAPFDEQLVAHGMNIAEEGDDLIASGRLQGGQFVLPGDVSSQYVTSLLLSAPLIGEQVEVFVSTPIQSRPYIDLTIESLAAFGVNVAQDKVGIGDHTHERFAIYDHGLHSPAVTNVEGDWSNAAFWLAAGALEADGITVDGLNLASAQGDRTILAALTAFGARIARRGDAARATRNFPRAGSLDVSHIPDLVPPLAAVAALSPGTTELRNAGRLRLKESDRLATVCAAINDLGGVANVRDDSIIIEGVPSLSGGVVDSANDHRIAMMAAILAAHATEDVIVRGAHCVSKSYPGFWDDFQQLGGQIDIQEG